MNKLLSIAFWLFLLVAFILFSWMNYVNAAEPKYRQAEAETAEYKWESSTIFLCGDGTAHSIAEITWLNPAPGYKLVVRFQFVNDEQRLVTVRTIVRGSTKHQLCLPMYWDDLNFPYVVLVTQLRRDAGFKPNFARAVAKPRDHTIEFFMESGLYPWD